MIEKRGVLLVNLGTPDEPEAEAVGRYLKEFLGDPRVIDVPGLLRWFLVNCIIVPKRKEESAANYRKVWTDRGSPLLFHGRDLEKAVDERLDAEVVLAMRYGSPSILEGLRELSSRGVKRPLVVPLFPQFAEATTGSVIAKVEEVIRKHGLDLQPEFVKDFADDAGFIEAQAAVLKHAVDLDAVDVLLMSFHGLPERQIQKADESGRCLTPGCCDVAEPRNAFCYRARCHATARALAEALGLPQERWRISFQSRLGKAKWIEPYTDALVDELVAEGKKRIAIVSPAFVADCIETIEELGISLREQIEEQGGSLAISPCVNADKRWADGLSALIEERWKA